MGRKERHAAEEAALRARIEANENDVIAAAHQSRGDNSPTAKYIREVADDIIDRRAATLYAEED